VLNRKNFLWLSWHLFRRHRQQRQCDRQAQHSARDSWIYIDGESFGGLRVDIGGDPQNPELQIARNYLWTAKDTWLGPTLGGTFDLPFTILAKRSVLA
jgi:hypothetical protein